MNLNRLSQSIKFVFRWTLFWPGVITCYLGVNCFVELLSGRIGFENYIFYTSSEDFLHSIILSTIYGFFGSLMLIFMPILRRRNGWVGTFWSFFWISSFLINYASNPYAFISYKWVIVIIFFGDTEISRFIILTFYVVLSLSAGVIAYEASKRKFFGMNKLIST